MNAQKSPRIFIFPAVKNTSMKTPKSKTCRRFFAALSAAVGSASLFASPSALATTYIYNSTGTTNWSTASWSPEVPTSSSDNVISITAPTGSPKVTTNNLGSGFQLNSLILTNSTSSTNPQNLSVASAAGSSLNFVQSSGGVLPTITLSKANSASTITISSAFTVTDALTISSTVPGGTTAISGVITNNGGITFNGGGAGGITVSGAASGAGGITVNGSYNVTLSGNNTYSGLTDVQSGTLTLNRAGGAIANTSAVQVSGGTLNVAQADTVGAVTLSSGTISGAGVLTGSSYSLTNTGTVSAALGGGGALTKTGAGTATLSGTNTYSGGTTVSTGTLLVASSGSLAGAAGTVSVEGGLFSSSVTSASLGGNLSIAGGSVTANGGSVGSFTLAADADFLLSSGTFGLTLASSASFDQIIGSGSGSVFTISGGILDLEGSVTDYLATYQIFSGFNSGSVSGLNIINYDTVGYTANLSNTGVLSFTAVPEPSAHALLGLGVGTLWFLRRKKSASQV